jgi:hypothetical protein
MVMQKWIAWARAHWRHRADFESAVGLPPRTRELRGNQKLKPTVYLPSEAQ